MSGIRYPEQISARMDTSHNSSFFSPNSRSICSSRQNALTTAIPETLSSTCPFSAPRRFCCAEKSFLVRLVTVLVSRKMRPTPDRDTSVKNGLKYSIITKMPMTVKPYVRRRVIELEMVVLILSTSFVRRLISSPCRRRSKKASGSVLMWSNSVLRI